VASIRYFTRIHASGGQYPISTRAAFIPTRPIRNRTVRVIVPPSSSTNSAYSRLPVPGWWESRVSHRGVYRPNSGTGVNPNIRTSSRKLHLTRTGVPSSSQVSVTSLIQRTPR
jgi:hypothetical protein